jgi:hypothetical protein
LPSAHSVQRGACCSEALLQLPYSMGLLDLAPKKEKYYTIHLPFMHGFFFSAVNSLNSYT